MKGISNEMEQVTVKQVGGLSDILHCHEEVNCKFSSAELFGIITLGEDN